MNRDVTIAREAGYSMAGFVFGQVVRFAFNLAAARMLGADALGVYALTVAVTQVGEVLAFGGLDSGVLKFVNQKEGLAQRQIIASAMKRSSVSALIVGGLVVLFSGLIARMLHGGEMLRLTLVCAAISLPLSVMTHMAGYTVQAYRRLIPIMVATQIMVPGVFLITMIAAHAVSGVQVALALPFLIAPLAGFLWILPQFGRVTGLGLGEIWSARSNRELNSFAMPLLVVSLFSMFSHWIDIVMLGLLADVRTVGIYQPAARTATLLRSLLLAFGGIAAPLIAGYFGRRDYQGVRDTYAMVSRWIVSIIMVPFLVLVLFPSAVLSVFGAGFSEGAGALIMLAVSALLLAWFGLGSTVLVMCGHERLSMYNQAGALLLQVLLHWLLIPRFGANGAALSMLIVMMLLTVVRMIELRLLLRIPFLSPNLWKPVMAGVLTGAVMLAVRSTGSALPPMVLLCAASLAGTVVYLLLILAFRLEQEEREVILKFMPFLNIQSKKKAP